MSATTVLDLELVGETDKAWQMTDGDCTVWLPKSQVEIIGQVSGLCEVEMQEKLAFQKRLI